MHPLRDELVKLVHIGIALTSERSLDRLLSRILAEARHFTGANAGSLYLRVGDRLRFTVTQCDTLRERLGDAGEQALFTPFDLPIDEHSIAGMVALTRRNLNLPDVYDLPPDAPYRLNLGFDQRTGYRTRSMLVVPMLDPRDEVLGVLQLINATRGGQVGPFPEDEEDLVRSLASQAAVAVHNAQLTEELKQVHLDTIFRLSVAAEYKDKDTVQHIRRMAHYSAAIARRMGWSESRAELLLQAAPMHDVGKIGIPDAILMKPGRLTPEERTVMETHTEIGARILGGSDTALLRLSEVVALTHHEKWDGTGYPQRLAGEDIPLEGRIVAVADVFDALCSRRVYKDAFGFEASVDIVRKDAGTHFDPQCVEAFLSILEPIRAIQDRFKEAQGQG